jgi:outer membrane immunogenic protein
LTAEYQYINLGKNDPVGVSGSNTPGTPISALGFKVEDDAFHTVRVGLNYHILPAYESLK